MKRLTSLILALLLLLMTGMLPVASAVSMNHADVKPEAYVFTEADNAAIETDVFASISQIEQSSAQTKGGIGHLKEQDYIKMLPQVIEAIESSETYKKGTLQQNGSFLVWQTTLGIPCCFDPRMEAELHNRENDPTPEEIRAAELEAAELAQRVRDSVCGGSPNLPNIGLIQPYWDSNSYYDDYSFTNYSPAYKAMWEALNEATGGEGRRYTMYNATIDNIAHTMSECGVVIFDSHGTTDYDGPNDDYTSRANCSYLCLITNAGITTEDTAPQVGPYGTYYHCIKGSGYAYVSGTCIANHMTSDAPNSLLYMGICLGMATDGMHKPLRERGVETVWGYSQSVSFSGDKAYMQSVLGNVKNGDEFGVAVSKAKEAHGNWDPAYSSYSESWARANRVAFPIVVSSEDVYPGHGNVDAVQTVNSTWTLFSTYEVSAVSNNPDWGTVSLIGHKITANPAEGYLIAGFEVIEGEAEVAQDGNVFTVTPASDCTIQINFAPREAGVLHFEVPEGMTCADVSGYIGDEAVLPAPEGTPTADAHRYKFVGWAAAPISDAVSDAPSFFKPGSSVTLTEQEMTFYALFSYFITDSGHEGDQFIRLTEEPSSWEGRYVFAYRDQKALDASGTVVGSSIASTKASVDLIDVGCILEGNALQNVPETLVYVVSPTENGTYTIKMENSNYYLAMNLNSDSLTTFSSAKTDKTRWSFSLSEDGAILTNAQYSSRSIQYSLSGNRFCCYLTGNQQPLTLYAASDGTTWYTTDPIDFVVCENHTFGDWTTLTAPTCTEDGLRERICTVCSFRETESVSALGHDYLGVVTEPTCTESGYTTYTCSRCGDTYTDDSVPATGHHYTLTAWSWAEDDASATAAFTCSGCHDIQRLTDDAISEEISVEARPHVAGEKTLTAEVLFNGTVYTDTKTLPIEALPCPCAHFVDVPEVGTPEHEAIDWAYTHAPYQITVGMDETHFGTDVIVTRAQAMTFLWAAKDKPTCETTVSPFTDVKIKKWYAKAILWAVENGITVGTGNNKFSPDKTCNRAEMLTFLYAALGKPSSTAENPYSDVSNSAWYKNAAIWAYENGIEQGDNGCFRYNTPCTRASTVLYIYRALASTEN